jgi:hypothetical protein
MKVKKAFNIFLMLLIFSILTATFAGAAPAEAAVNYPETFETDTVGSNPSASWYTYTESGWEYANVNDTVARDTQSMRFNDTSGSDPAETAWFNWSTDEFDYLEFYFYVNTTNNNDTRIYILDGANAWGRVDLNDTHILIRNGTGLSIAAEQVLTTETWYRVRFDFNYTTNYCRVRLYNGTTLENDSWADAGGARTGVTGLNFQSYNGKKSHIYVDDITVYKNAIAATGTDATVDYIKDIVVPILVAIILFMLAMNYLVSGNVTKENLLMIMVTIIVAIIVLSVIIGL